MAIENIGLFPINIDVYKKHAVSTVQANDNDMNGRGLLISLVKDGVPINSTGITLKIGFRNAVNEERIYNCDIVDAVTGKYKVFYPTEMLSGNGGRVVKVEIKAYEPNGALLNYAPMFVYVSASEIPDSATLSTNEGSLLTKAITEYEGVNASYAIDEGQRSISENARVTAEGIRNTSEIARVTAEGSRVTAETNRATFYDGFSAQLGEIANKSLKLKNVITNGNQEKRILQASVDTTTQLYSIIAELGLFYMSYDLIQGSATSTRNTVSLRNGSTNVYFADLSNDANSVTGRKSYLINVLLPINNLAWRVNSTVSDVIINNVTFINLTTMFGVGNEPTKSEINTLIKLIGWFDGELSVPEKHLAIWTLNLIRQNRNAIVALGGTIV